MTGAAGFEYGDECGIFGGKCQGEGGALEGVFDLISKLGDCLLERCEGAGLALGNAGLVLGRAGLACGERLFCSASKIPLIPMERGGRFFICS